MANNELDAEELKKLVEEREKVGTSMDSKTCLDAVSELLESPAARLKLQQHVIGMSYVFTLMSRGATKDEQKEDVNKISRACFDVADLVIGLKLHKDQIAKALRSYYAVLKETDKSAAGN